MKLFKTKKRIVKTDNMYQCQARGLFGNWNNMSYYDIIEECLYNAKFNNKKKAIDFVNGDYDCEFHIVYTTDNKRGCVIEYKNISGTRYVCETRKNLLPWGWEFKRNNYIPFNPKKTDGITIFPNKESAIKYLEDFFKNDDVVVYTK